MPFSPFHLLTEHIGQNSYLLERDLIDGVILLPDNLFYNTDAAGIIILLRKSKPKSRQGKVVLVNASRQFRKRTPKNNIPAVYKICSQYFARGVLPGRSND